MATTNQKVPRVASKAQRVALNARLDERFLAPFKDNTFGTRTWFSVSLAVVLALHGVGLGLLLYRDATRPKDPPPPQETPIEVVQEAPKPPPPPPQQQQEIEKPASSAPRAETDTKVDTEKLDAKTEAPKAVTPPQDGQAKPAEEAAKEAKDDAEQDAQEDAAKPPDVLEKDAEALDKAADEPKKEPKPAKKVVARQKRPKPAMQQLAGLSDLPDYHFARKTKKSPVSGGTEDSRYLAIVYGLIMQRVRAVGEGSVSVSFELDDNGDVLHIDLIRSSGDPLADEAVIGAVQRASPFPPPPPNRPHGLTATVDFSRHPFATGER